ncbi:MAG: (Fe-S)-binding protein, partial [Desulfovibrio sp.]|nr:(Fe-S)-binding protein [Desulfovibrio sp.]
PDKETLISLLASIQVCTRCGKCKLVCPMCYPERSMQYQPRNKNMALGMLLEAVYYSQLNTGKIDDRLLRQLRDLVEHCTACGRCMANCPVRIPSGEVALSLRGMLEHEGAGGHPLKDRALDWLVKDVEHRVPKAAKMASLGQKMQNRILDFVPKGWQKRIESPLFSGKGPKTGYTNLYESLKLHRGSVFAPREPEPGMELALYFPGCGGALFHDRIGMSSIMLMLEAGLAVAVPPRHLCCGYPLLAAGKDTAFDDNQAITRQYLASMLRNLAKQGFDCRWLVTACGSCRDSMERTKLTESFPGLKIQDISQLTLPRLASSAPRKNQPVPIYHGSCHCEWADVHKIKGQNMLVQALRDFSGSEIEVSRGCCGESGMGAMTSPGIYNLLRERKRRNLEQAFAAGNEGPVIAGCPSCKIGLGRTLLAMHEKRPVLHIAEWIAGQIDGEDRRQSFRKRVNETRGAIRIVRPTSEAAPENPDAPEELSV